MFSYAMAKEKGLYVGIYTGVVGDEDYAQCLSSMTEFERAVRGQPDGLVAILVTDPGVEAVPPAWRKRMASFNDNVQASRFLLSIVTPSSLIRGILTAINWLSPARQGHQRKAHETFDEARTWIEKTHGRPQPQLVELYHAARSKLTLSQTG